MNLLYSFVFCVNVSLTLPFSIQMFISALIDVAGHAGKVDAAFEILEEARAKGMPVGVISYSSLMGACSNVWASHLLLIL